MGILLIPSVNAFSPPPPDEGKILLCESTGGTKNITYVGGYDPKTGIDRAIATIVNCNCPEGLTWNTTVGCIKADSVSIQTQDRIVQKQTNNNIYVGLGILIIFTFAIIFLKLRKK